MTIVMSPVDSHNGSKAALLYGLVAPVARVAQAYLRQLSPDICPPLMPEVQFKPFADGLEFSYVSLNVYYDALTVPQLPKYWYHNKEKRRLSSQHAGLYLHRDDNNDGWGAILVFGVDMRGFEQGYVTLSLELPMSGWSLVLRNFTEILHSVYLPDGARGTPYDSDALPQAPTRRCARDLAPPPPLPLPPPQPACAAALEF